MRRLAPLCLVLAWMPAAAPAGPPGCRACEAGSAPATAATAPVVMAAPAMDGAPVEGAVVRGPHLCARCAARMKKQLEAQGPGGSAPMVVMDGLPPGAVVIGEAPGHATVGGPVASAEPAPIGVVRAGYAPAGGLGRPGMTAPEPPGRAELAPSSLVGPAPGPRPRAHVLGHLFGVPRVPRLYEVREARRRASHAAISYGTNARATDLPASMVYGH